MNGPQNTLSPVSADGSEWSAVARYQSFNNPDSPFSPVIPSSRGGAPITPPISGSSTMMTNGGQIGVGHGPNDSPSNPSPPSSIARSSVGTGLSSEGGQSRRAAMLEEKLSEHYVVLRRYLAPSLRDEKGNTRPNRARDKLLRLSAVQFQELSTDVFDELLRRQSAAAIANGNGSEKPPHATPPDYLLPKDSFHPKRNQARQKLSTLPPPRFRDLATDVFYELERRFPRFVGGDIDRVGSPASLRGPPSRNGTPVLGARPGSRGAGFRGPGHSSINSNSSYTRNGPPGGPSNMGLHVPGGSPQNEYGRPLPKTFQSNTVIPNKSTLVEDDDDQTGPDDDDDDEDAFGLEGAAGKRQSKRNTNRSFVTESKDKKIISDQQTQINQLEDKIDTLEGRVREQDEELGRLQDSKESDLSAANRQREQWSAFKSDLANKLTKAEDLNNSLLSELERLRTEGSANERDLRLQLDQVSKAGSSGDSQWKGRHDSLQAQFESIKIELNEQQQVTEEVKRDAAESLQEMKVLSERSHQCWEREEKLVRQVSELEKEIQEWKGRYARTRTQLRMFHASSMGSALQQQDAGQYVKDHAYTRTDGLVKDVHVTKYQMSIDDLLRVARSSEPSAVNELMKSVVLSVRRITQDIDDAALSDKNADQIRNKLKARISATANNLITAARNFATSNGLSPVSLLDAAASHLSAAVVDLVRVVKIRPTQNTEDESDGRITPGESPINFPEEYQRATSSIYSAATSPRDSDLAAQPIGNHPWIARQPPSRSGYTSKQGPGQAPDQKFEYNSKSQDEAIEGLKIYLEDQTEGLVRSIQYLVASIRADEENSTIVKHIDSIAGIVGDVVTSTETAFEQTGNKDLRRQVGPVIHALANCRIKLTNAGAESRGISDRIAMKEFTNKIPPIAFEIARETKELCQTVDHVGLE